MNASHAMLRTVHTLPRGRIHVARAEEVYPSIEPGSVELVISDGPYRMTRKPTRGAAVESTVARWDRVDIAEWYAQHIEAWGRVCGADSTVVLFGNAESVRELYPLMLAAGWRFRRAVTWNKVSSGALLRPQPFPNVSEHFDIWTRGKPAWHRVKHETRLDTKRQPATITNVLEMQTNSVGGHFQRVERLRSGGTTDRSLGVKSREVLHPTQKPLELYRYILRALSNPGDTVLEPFGGTCRAAVACEALPGDEARQYICIEPDEDGRGYVPAVLASMGVGVPALPVRPVPPLQPSLWDAT